MAKTPSIYLDSCYLIDMARVDYGVVPVGKRAEEAWLCKKMLLAAQDGKLKVFTSILAVPECRYIKDEADKTILNDEVRRLFDVMLLSGESGITLVQNDIFVVNRARDLLWEHDINLKPYDSLHVASALEMKCDEFISDDRKTILKKAEEIKKLGMRVCSASETAVLPPQYRQGSIEEMVTLHGKEAATETK
ncbi:MAG: PIN domain-containing protein [Proteobacteria bacterium]|nr:PIN domain-containing protein [Pseudomonadota bacterium]MBU4382447.1 PIN domain-containing protein [Pseudomonadota bacterium]MBU4606500.1 PIN domain-containing protein [Pseudomonadota bacterium]MCG2764015.1 PIN domain-containing protein [Desulfarculaceae bacterium]